jgi:hypothetical protein
MSHAKDGEPIRCRQGSPSHHPGKQMKGRGQRRTRQPGGSAGVIYHIDGQRSLELNVSLAADAPQESEGLVIAAKHYMLPVVDALAGDRIRESRGTAPKCRTGLEHQHAGTRLGECGRRTQTGKPAANDNDVRDHRDLSERCWQAET